MLVRWFRLVALSALAILAGSAGARAAIPPNLPTQAICAAETALAERSYGIPSQLLDAISLVESGRYDSESKATLAWPWTVMAEGEGRYFPTKAEAVAEVRKLQARGVRNIDVGCMQVNMMYHGQAFASIEDAFEPASNVAYAARFLKGLYESTNHWPTAASYYHSQTPSLAANYRSKLMKVWNGGGSRAAIASLRPLDGSPAARQWAGRPSPADLVTQQRKEALAERILAQEEGKRIADAYRQARLVEYQLRRAKMVEMREARAR